MTKVLSIMAILMIAVSVQARKISDYVVHHRIAGSSTNEGTWDNDYIQLIPRAGHPLSAGDIKINDKLKKPAQESRCPADGLEPEIRESNLNSASSEYKLKTTVTFVSDRLLAVSISEDASCVGTAHPSSGVSSTIYDRNLGKAIDISTGLPVKEDDYLTALPAFNQLVLNKMSKQAAKEKAKAAREGYHDCDDSYEDLKFNLSGIALSSKVISVNLATVHANQACEFTTVIPLEEFLPIAIRGSVLEELAKAASKK